MHSTDRTKLVEAFGEKGKQTTLADFSRDCPEAFQPL